MHVEGVGLCDGYRTTRGGWFIDGPVDPLDLRGSLFLMEGVSNGGLVWKLGGNIDLRVGDKVEHGLHEHSRSLLVAAPFLFVERAEAVWTDMPREKSARAADKNRMINRGTQSIRDYLIQVHGNAVVTAARRIAERMNLTVKLDHALAYNGHSSRLNRISLVATAKGIALRMLERDPSKELLRTLANHTQPERSLGNLPRIPS